MTVQGLCLSRGTSDNGICYNCRCVHELYGIAKANWDAFIGPDIVDLFGHLMIYPMLVNQDGRHATGPASLAIPEICLFTAYQINEAVCFSLM